MNFKNVLKEQFPAGIKKRIKISTYICTKEDCNYQSKVNPADCKLCGSEVVVAHHYKDVLMNRHERRAEAKRGSK